MAIFDPDDLVRSAGRIEEHAEALRARARSLSAAAQQARWHSPAATAWRAQVVGLDRRMQHAAHNLDRAAHELRMHATRVRTLEAAVGAAVRLERTAAHDAAQVVAGTGHVVRHWAGKHL